MFRLISLVTAFLLMGCNSTEPDDPSLATGTYQHAITAADGVVLLQLQVKSDGDYNGKTYLTLFDGSMDCLMSEGAGKWAATASLLKMTDRKLRARDACEDAFTEWESLPDQALEVRNITKNSFELFLASDDETPASWLKFILL